MLSVPDKCPVCGQMLIDLRVDLDSRSVIRGDRSVKLRPSHAVILHKLARVMPRVVTKDQMVWAIWGDQELEDAENGINVRLCSLRRIIAPIGLKIHTVWRRGWYLTVCDPEVGS